MCVCVYVCVCVCVCVCLCVCIVEVMCELFLGITIFKCIIIAVLFGVHVVFKVPRGAPGVPRYLWCSRYPQVSVVSTHKGHS